MRKALASPSGSIARFWPDLTKRKNK
jgi:hypothetical protein